MILALTWGLGLALAADPAEYAQVAELDLPPTGPALIDLDDAQLWAGRDDLLLLDAEGREVPYVLLGSWQPQQGGCQTVPWDPVGPPPRYDTIRIDTRPLGRVVDRLIVDPGAVGGGLFSGGSRILSIGDGAFAVPIEVTENGRAVAEGLLWRADIAHAERENFEIEVPNLPPGQYELKAPGALRWRGVKACWTATTDIQPLSLDVEVEGPFQEVEGRSRYALRLPAAGLELMDLELQIVDPRFARTVSLHAPSYSGADPEGQRVAVGEIERLSLGGATIDHVTLDVDRSVGDRLLLRVDDGRDAALEITGATARLRNRQLLVVDAGPGPHRLLAAPASPRRETYDLDHAVVELLRQEPPRLRPARWEPNPAYNPAERMPQALLRGAEASLTGYQRSRVAEAPRAGVATRWRLPYEVALRSRSNFGDLRLVDASGHQVPYVLEDAGVSDIQVSVSVESQSGRTLIRVTLPEPAQIQDLVLRTSSEIYSRSVWLEGQGRHRWERGPDEPARALRIPLSGHAGGPLLIEIDDGDDQPLQGLEVEALARDLALVAAAPEGGATLWYDNPQAQPPDYDLRLLTDRLLSGVVEEGSLGPVVVKESVSDQDRRLGLLAVGVLAVTLVGLVLWLLRDPEDEGSPTA